MVLSTEDVEGLPTILKVGQLSDPTLQSMIDHALDGVPPDHGNAALTFSYKGGEGALVYLTIAERLGENWSIKAVGKVNWPDPHPEGQVELRGSW